MIRPHTVAASACMRSWTNSSTSAGVSGVVFACASCLPASGNSSATVTQAAS